MSNPKSKRGAARQYDALMRRYRRDWSGGGMFGFDWPTMRLNAPDTYARLQELARLHQTLPE